MKTMKKLSFAAIAAMMIAFTACTEDPVEPAPTADEILVGEWYSAGDNVASLLSTYFNADSIYAKFNDDNTYHVEQFNIGNETTIADATFTGTYTTTLTEEGSVHVIALAQENPYVAEASGIFEIIESPEVLWYEVVQTSGTQNVPPTVDGGFGSTNGGTLGDSNIQKFVRLD